MKLFLPFVLVLLLFFSAWIPADSLAQELLFDAVPDIIPACLDIPDSVFRNAGTEDLSSGYSLRIAQVSDIHHYSSDLYDEDSDVFQGFSYNNEGRSILYSAVLLDALKRELLERKINTLLVSGDLSVFGAEETHLEVAGIFTEYENAGIRVFITSGNHDINNPRALEITKDGTEATDTVSPDRFRNIYNDFGFFEAVMSHDESLSYLAELDENNLLLSLDTSYYQDNFWLDYSASPGIILSSLYDFTVEALDYAEAAGLQVIVMSHHNFLAHYEIDFDLSTFMINDDGRMKTLLAGRNVGLALSGHIHKTDVKAENVGENTFISAALTSFAMYPHTYRIIGLNHRSAGISTVNLDSGFFPEQKDEILVYNWYIYYHRNFRNNYYRLLENRNPAEAAAMAEFFYIVNLYAQQGLEEYLPTGMSESVGAQLYAESDSFMKGFAASLPIDSPPSDRNLLLAW